jgi:hypothetical protein
MDRFDTKYLNLESTVIINTPDQMVFQISTTSLSHGEKQPKIRYETQVFQVINREKSPAHSETSYRKDDAEKLHSQLIEDILRNPSKYQVGNLS